MPSQCPSSAPFRVALHAWLALCQIVAFAAGAGASNTVRVSESSAGAEGNDHSYNRSYVSGNGRFVSFYSNADNLVPGDNNATGDGFVRDLARRTTERVTIDSAGDEWPGGGLAGPLSYDGRYVTIRASSQLAGSPPPNYPVILVHDRETLAITNVSVSSSGESANQSCSDPDISADGRFVAFNSGATNLIVGDTNARDDIFVHDTATGETTRVSISGENTPGNGHCNAQPEISDDGRYVVFESDSTNLVAGDINDSSDIFVHDRVAFETVRVSVDSAGFEANHDSGNPAISGNGRYVAYASSASNLVADDTNSVGDIFVHDMLTGLTTRVSVDSQGHQVWGSSSNPSLSYDGLHVAFESTATTLVAGDGNESRDTFVHDRTTGLTTRVSIGSTGNECNGASFYPSIADDGTVISFETTASNLVTGDNNARTDIFAHAMRGFAIFTDGFETGNNGQWSLTVP